MKKLGSAFGARAAAVTALVVAGAVVAAMAGTAQATPVSQFCFFYKPDELDRGVQEEGNKHNELVGIAPSASKIVACFRSTR